MRILRETLMGLATLNCPVGLGIAALFGALGSFFLLKGRTRLAKRHPEETGKQVGD
ncbi:MAG: hypothetical protein ABIK54_07210 [candidate division WOR-3 bacterium]